MADIKTGDKVKLNKTLSYKEIVMKNGEVENESTVSWDEGTEHTVTTVVGELFVMLEDVSAMVPVSYVEKVEKFYTGKVVCVCWPKQARDIFTVGKVYEINNGVISCNDMTKLPKIKKLDELNNNPNIAFIEIKNPEALEEETYYNGKVICIDSHGKDTIWTKGKIYKFENGRTLCDNGTVIPYESRMPIKTFNELNIRMIADFIEIKE